MLDFSTVEAPSVPYIRVEIAEVEVPVYDSCDAQPDGMAWLADMQIQLCPDSCAEFEDAGQLTVDIGCPGGP